MKRYKITVIGFLISGVVLLHSLINKVDLFEKIRRYLSTLEAYEIDEFIIPLFIFLSFALLDLVKRQIETNAERERIQIYKAMLSSTHHVLNNFLHQMQIFKLTAESTSDFDPDILQLYDQIIRDASEQLDALGSITTIDASSIHNSVAPKTAIDTQTRPSPQ